MFYLTREDLEKLELKTDLLTIRALTQVSLGYPKTLYS